MAGECLHCGRTQKAVWDGLQRSLCCQGSQGNGSSDCSQGCAKGGTLMPIIEGLVQNTPEWLMHRIGMVTASRVVDVVTKLKSGKYSSARDKYLMDVVIERLTGRASETYVSPAMEWGIETEPLAKAAYEIEKDVELTSVGFVTHPTIEWFGCSPDSFVGDEGLLEAKCPNTSTHLAYQI